MSKIVEYITDNKKLLLFLIGIIMLAFLLRLNDLLNDSLWFDEIFSLGIALKSIPQILEATAKDVHPPFYYVILHYWIKLFSGTDVAIRLLSVLFSMASITILFIYVKKYFGKWLAILSSLLLALSNLEITYSIEVRMYSLLALLAMISWFSFYSYIDEKKIRSLVIYVIATTLLLYTHNFFIFIILAQILYFGLSIILNFHNEDSTKSFWSYLIRTMYIRNILFASVVIILLFIPWFEYFYRQVQSVNQSFWIQKISYLAFLEVAVEFCGSLLLVSLFTTLIFYFLIQKNKLLDIFKKQKYLFLFVWLIVPVAIPIVLSASNLTSSIFQIKYFLPSLPPFLIIISIIFEKIYLKSTKYFLIILLLTITFSLHSYFSNDKSKYKENWKELAHFIDNSSKNNDVVAIEVSKEFDFIGGSEILIKHYSKRQLIYLNLNLKEDYDKLETYTNTDKNIFLIQRPAKELKQEIKLKLNKHSVKDYSNKFKVLTKRYFFMEEYDKEKYNLYLEKRSESIPISIIKYSRK